MNARTATLPTPKASDSAAPCCDETATTQSPLPPEPRLHLPAPEVGDAVAAASLVADRTRASILRMLADGPLCVCEMAAALGERQNNVSNHLARLREAGLVRAVRHSGDARWMFYERDEERCRATAAAITDLLR
jgi:ArsR family transcriptional regulator, arsenate/arsenite/antimonite-responsive transcriptional repressor